MGYGAVIRCSYNGPFPEVSPEFLEMLRECKRIDTRPLHELLGPIVTQPTILQQSLHDPEEWRP